MGYDFSCFKEIADKTNNYMSKESSLYYMGGKHHTLTDHIKLLIFFNLSFNLYFDNDVKGQGHTEVMIVNNTSYYGDTLKCQT